MGESMDFGDLAGLALSSGCNEAVLSELQARVGNLPDDYLAFLRTSNGARGSLGSQMVNIWPAEEVADANRDYQVELYASGLLFFGSTGGGEGFGLDRRSTNQGVFLIPFIGMSWKDAIPLAPDFISFLRTYEDWTWPED